MKKDYAPESNEESLGVSRESHDYYAAHARRWRNRVGLGVFVVIILFWAYTLFATPFFAVQSLTILGFDKIQPEEIENRINTLLAEKRWGILPRNNIFLLRPDRIVAYFKNDARIADIKIQKNYQDRSLTATIEERLPIYILSLPNRAFAIDKEGIGLIPLSVPAPQGTLPIILDKRPNEATLGTQVIANKEMAFLNTIHTELPRIAPFTNVTIGEPSEDALTIKTEENWQIYLSFSDDARGQIERLKVLLSAKIKPTMRKKLQYIDLRFGERVYYK